MPHCAPTTIVFEGETEQRKSAGASARVANAFPRARPHVQVLRYDERKGLLRLVEDDSVTPPIPLREKESGFDAPQGIMFVFTVNVYTQSLQLRFIEVADPVSKISMRFF